MKNNKGPSRKFKHSLENNIFAKLFRTIGRIVDLLFSNNIIIIIISVVCSALLYLYVIGMPNQLDLSNFDTRTLEDIKVDVINDDNAKVVDIYNEEGTLIDENEIIVDVIIKGPRNEVLKVVNNKDYHFILDTSDVQDGESKLLSVVADNIPNDVTVTTSPPSFLVEANKRVVRDDLTLTTEVVNKTKLGSNLSIEEVRLNTNEVHISGSKVRIDEVSIVKALINVENITSVGDNYLDESRVSYKAYNSKGSVVDVEIDVKDKGATVVTSNYSRDVELRYNFIGSTPEGKSIGLYETSVSTVSIYGDKSEIDTINFINIDINLNELKSGTKKVVRIPTPEGVAIMSETETTVTINYENTTTRLVEGVPVQGINLAPEYGVQSVGETELQVDVELIGAQSAIDAVTLADIYLQVDLAGLTPGEHTVDVHVINPNSIIDYKLSKAKVVVQIFENE